MATYNYENFYEIGSSLAVDESYSFRVANNVFLAQIEKVQLYTWIDLPSFRIEFPDKTHAPDRSSVALDGNGTSMSSGSHATTP